MSNIKIGVIKKHDNMDATVVSCSCGNTKIEYSEIKRNCDNCGNTIFIVLSKCDNRKLIPHLEVLKSDRKGFKVKRTNLSVIIDDKYKVTTKKNQIQVINYDFINNQIKLWKNGTLVVDYTHGKHNAKGLMHNNTYQRFFHQIDDAQFVKKVTSEEIGELLDFTYKELSQGDNWSSGRKIYRGLVRLFDNKHIQVLANAGYTNLRRFKEGHSYWNRASILNKEGSNPREILGLPKFAINIVREDNNISIHDIRNLRESLQKINGNMFKEMVNIAKDEGSVRKLLSMIDTIAELNDKYEYNNIKKLTLYLFREIKMNQGITNPSEGATLLRDYIKMSKSLEQEYDKYPKSLKKEHDIAQMNYKVKESEIKQKEFNDKVTSEEYKMLEMKTKDFSIISPTAMIDLIKEGNELSHCVASYVGAITSGNCNIYFLRKTDNIDNPHATIEVRGGRVRQARGYANRQLTKDEREFITAWAKKKGLDENYYY